MVDVERSLDYPHANSNSNSDCYTYTDADPRCAQVTRRSSPPAERRLQLHFNVTNNSGQIGTARAVAACSQPRPRAWTWGCADRRRHHGQSKPPRTLPQRRHRMRDCPGSSTTRRRDCWRPSTRSLTDAAGDVESAAAGFR